MNFRTAKFRQDLRLLIDSARLPVAAVTEELKNTYHDLMREQAGHRPDPPDGTNPAPGIKPFSA